MRILTRLVLGLLVLVLLVGVLGSVRDWHVVTVTRAAEADRDVLWDLWADVPSRTDWDRGLERISIDGPFQEGTTGEVVVEGQDPVGYRLVEVVPKERYTDRFESLLWTHTDWHHSLVENPEGSFDVTWRLEARGPLALASLPVLKGIFGEEVPTAVDEYVDLAESRSR